MKSIIFLSLLLSCSLAANTYTIYAGFDVNGWISLNFFPSVLTIAPGDSVTFVPLTDDLVITFSPQTLPLFLGTSQNGDLLFSPTTYQATGGTTVRSMFGIYSSGFLEMGTNWTLTFPNSGVFSFYNALGLPWMTGTIVVSNFMGVVSPQQVDTLARLSLANVAISVFPDLTIATGALATLPSGRKLSDGTYEWTVRMAGDIWTLSSLARFLPSNFTIGVGDSIIFVNDDITIHTVSFNSSGTWMPEIFNDSNGYIVFNGIFAEQHSSDNYTGGFANSGFLLPLSLRPRVNITAFAEGLNAHNFTFSSGGSSNAVLASILNSNNYNSLGGGGITNNNNNFGQGVTNNNNNQGQGITNNNNNLGQGQGVTNNNNNFGQGVTNNNNNQGQGITNTNNNMGGTITNNNLGSMGGGATNNNNNLGVSAGATTNNNFNFGNLMSNTTMAPKLLHYWRIRFGAAGTYPYRCDLHFDEGMVGQIIVRHRNATMGMK